MYSILPFGHSTIDRFFDDVERDFAPSSQTRVPAFRTDIRDEGDHYLLEADLPGYRKEDIDLDIHDGVLTITAKHDQTSERKDDNGRYIYRERRIGSCQRSFDVSGIRENGISATYDNGILRLTLPKITAEDSPRHRISIQ